jgi:repressor LexA
MMARKRSTKLTERQRKILEVLEHFQNNAGYPPSIREICEQAGISSTSVVNYYLEQLAEMGYIQRDERVSRGIRLVRPLSEINPAFGIGAPTTRTSVDKAGQAISDLLRIPVLGRIVAGSPMPMPSSDFSYYDADSMVDIAGSLLPARDRDKLFALEVKGDSMIDAMINDGDLVVMKPATQANNGDMVAVWLTDKDETTLKYYFLENKKVRLQPANPTMDPIIVDNPDTVQIQGKVVMVIRQIREM